MATYYSPRIVTDGLTTYFDAGNEKSFPGQNTTNLSANEVPGNYNNVPSDVTTTITATSETYNGKTVYKQVLTPTTASGVSYLTAGGNPGLGVVHGGGGGLASRYTGHSIFFKPTVPMHSSPIFTHYSNIAGWQSSTNYDNMGDGWYRAHVIWYDTVTRSDGKYWAINPAAATLNTPIVIYWAAPFKEDMNYSTAVSRYTSGTRGAYWYDLAANATATAYNAGGTTYSSVAAGTPILANEAGGALTLDGSNDWIKMASQVTMNSNCTVSAWVKFASSGEMGLISHCSGGPVNLAYGFKSGKVWYQYYTSAWQEWSGTSSVNTGTWKNVAWVKSGTTMTTYINGVQDATTTLVGNTTGPLIAIGCKWGPCNSDSYGAGTDSYGSMFNGTISNLMLYPSKTLTAAEVKQNYDALKGRYGLS
jgi:hypothetical protein